MDDNRAIRVNKFLSEAGFCSRRKADELIDAGQVLINGLPIEKGTRVSEGDRVTVNGQLVKKSEEQFEYLAFNKPVGIVCTTDTKREKDNIIDYLNYHKRVFPIGRLDKMSEGLILLTNDGDIVNKILRSSNNHEKEYLVTVDQSISQTFVDRMSKGVPVLDTMTKPCKVTKVNQNNFKIVLTQGLNRQIRRMCEYFNYEVISLKRLRIMNIELDMPIGEIRHLRPDEIEQLKSSLSDSKKTARHP
ncbi:MAG: 23S rRNA pseudouridine(2604) synthase RluF [Bacteroidetes bacterium]|nr:23S rRNA pseudouridine(2604) synthase RluF [Bacteroidota bacterium]MDA0879664.1 23S rRNA pseudouridine(2604) synthase RluF [Bacteroidota bacterium]MDA1116190.1 23S rRNA pseudouridine(2604) synthase RluF [Bacteroidota bacterium]